MFLGNPWEYWALHHTLLLLLVSLSRVGLVPAPYIYTAVASPPVPPRHLAILIIIIIIITQTKYIDDIRPVASCVSRWPLEGTSSLLLELALSMLEPVASRTRRRAGPHCPFRPVLHSCVSRWPLEGNGKPSGLLLELLRCCSADFCIVRCCTDVET